MKAEQRLEELNIQLPDAPQPVAIYRPAVQVGNLLFVSGHGPNRADGTQITGKVGVELTAEEGKEAARVTGLCILSTVRNTLGSLDRVVRVVKVLGMVNATPDFGEQPQVINGFSELMMEVFGDPGKGARSAVGMGSLPGNIPVEVEAIFEVE
jgi:enamine deaminase RidA (YjgF/YER057c/UK114 family)